MLISYTHTDAVILFGRLIYGFWFVRDNYDNNIRNAPVAIDLPDIER